MPEAFAELTRIYDALERHYRDMQDIEFTVEQGKLWMLQTRSGKRTAKAALRIAVELASEGLITQDEAVTRVDPASLDQLLHPTIDPDAERDDHRDAACRPRRAPPAARSCSPPTRPRALKAQGRKVILVRVETRPEDIHGMHAAEGILTARGGMTSHAAVVARGMGKPCVSGAGALRIDYAADTMTVGGQDVPQGRHHHHRRLDRPGAARRGADDGAGTVRRVRDADGLGRRQAPLKVRANADTPNDAQGAASSAPKASASAAPSTCSSRATASSRCAR